MVAVVAVIVTVSMRARLLFAFAFFWIEAITLAHSCSAVVGFFVDSARCRARLLGCTSQFCQPVVSDGGVAPFGPLSVSQSVVDELPDSVYRRPPSEFAFISLTTPKGTCTLGISSAAPSRCLS